MHVFAAAASLSDMLNTVNGWIWGWTLLLLILGVGVYLTLRTGAVQVFHLGRALRLIRPDDSSDSGVSTFGALCTALSATIGTGNIIGVATAVSAGGPGALLWMLVAAFFGMATKYAEGLLAMKYRIPHGNGFLGGPFYYIERGMGRSWRWLGKLFALFGSLAGLLGIGTLTQSNSITTAVEGVLDADRSAVAFTCGDQSYTWTTLIVGGVVTVCAALVILGGIRRIAKVAEVIVPFMLCVYVVLITIILITYAHAIPAALSLMVHAAFDPKAALGAAAGVTVKTAVRMGVGRGIFSNEAGLGTEAIAAAAARTKHPVQQGMVCMTGTFIDTVVLCTVAGLVLIVTGAYQQEGLQGVAVTAYAWQEGLPFDPAISAFLLMLCLVFFAFSTILGWNYYAEQCMRYLCDGRPAWMRGYRFLYILAVGIGPYLSVSSVWTVADICNGCMAFPNLIALIALSGVVARETRDHFVIRR